MICFDTHVLIWGVQEKGKAGQQHLVERAKRYIHHLDQQNERIMIPAPVVGEYLVGFNGEALAKQKNLIQRYFFVPSLDFHAAAIQAEIEGDRDLLKRIQAGNGLDRQQLRVDSQIIAIALINKAKKIISHDPHMRELANGRIRVEEIPEIMEQMPISYMP